MTLTNPQAALLAAILLHASPGRRIVNSDARNMSPLESADLYLKWLDAYSYDPDSQHRKDITRGKKGPA